MLKCCFIQCKNRIKTFYNNCKIFCSICNIFSTIQMGRYENFLSFIRFRIQFEDCSDNGVLSIARLKARAYHLECKVVGSLV